MAELKLKAGWLQRVMHDCCVHVKALAKLNHMSVAEQEEFTKDFKFCGNCIWCCGPDGKPYSN